jgi:hypothetical protein
MEVPMVYRTRLVFVAALGLAVALMGCASLNAPVGQHGQSAEEGEPCGSVHCPEGTGCCNASCGICARPDEACIQLACEGEDDAAPPGGGNRCGPVTCGAGEVCCNESCGICTEPEGACIQLACDACTPMDAAGEGQCFIFFGYAWNGEACVSIGGCSCKGAHCPHLFADRRECERQYQACLGDERTVLTGPCARTTGDACSTDADCATGGCGGELCYAPAAHDGPPMTTCDCEPPQGSCGCVAGTCAWYQ